MNKKVLILVVVIAVAVAVGVGGYFYSQSKARRLVEDLFNNVPGVSKSEVGRVNYAVFKKTLVVDDVDLNFTGKNPEKLEIKQMVLEKPNIDRFEHLISGEGDPESDLLAESYSIAGVKVRYETHTLSVGQYRLMEPRLGKLPFGNLEKAKADPSVFKESQIVKAFYHQDEEQISLLVRTPDGNSRVVPISKSAFTFRGKPHTELPRQETDREMFKTAELLNRRQGKFVSLEVFKSQA